MSMSAYTPPATGRALLLEAAYILERRSRRTPPGQTWGADWYKSEGKPVVLALLAAAERTLPTRATLFPASDAALAILPTSAAAPWPSLREYAFNARYGPGYQGDIPAFVEELGETVRHPWRLDIPWWVWAAAALAGAAALKR